MNTYDLGGRHAVITGGAAGIGLAIARRMLASGALVALWDRDPAALERAKAELGPEVSTVLVDLTKHEQVVEATAKSLKQSASGAVDILINSAGITGPNGPVETYPLESWDQVIEINLRGTFYCCRELVGPMKASGYGRIVNLASIAGKEGNPNASAYSASKAGVIALTKSLGKELAQTGIRVNCIAPATIRTGLLDQMKPEFIDYMLSKIPMARFGEVEEVAALATWLASEDCSFSTGATFDLSGGRATY